jgi:hypothetical protein
VVWAADGRGGSVLVERCPFGAGSLALTLSLIPGEPMLATPREKKLARYRPHRCIDQRAHSAASFEGKRDGKVANEIFRQLGPEPGKRRP